MVLDELNAISFRPNWRLFSRVKPQAEKPSNSSCCAALTAGVANDLYPAWPEQAAGHAPWSSTRGWIILTVVCGETYDMHYLATGISAVTRQPALPPLASLSNWHRPQGFDHHALALSPAAQRRSIHLHLWQFSQWNSTATLEQNQLP